MNVIPIGKGMCRIIVRSKTKRESLSRIPGILIEGSRVIFPENLTAGIRMIVDPPVRRKSPKPVQEELF